MIRCANLTVISADKFTLSSRLFDWFGNLCWGIGSFAKEQMAISNYLTIRWEINQVSDQKKLVLKWPFTWHLYKNLLFSNSSPTTWITQFVILSDSNVNDLEYFCNLLFAHFEDELCLLATRPAKMSVISRLLIWD